MTKEQREIIDGMKYIEMLRKWRHAPIGDILFQGETGLYYDKSMKEKGNELTAGEKVAISKHIGW